MVCIENNMMNYLLPPLNCEQGKCPPLLLPLLGVIILQSLYPLAHAQSGLLGKSNYVY